MPINYYLLVEVLTGIFLVGAFFSLPFGLRRSWLWVLVALPWAAEVLEVGDFLLTLPTDLFAGLGGAAIAAYLFLWEPSKLREAWQQSLLLRFVLLYFMWMGVTVLFSSDAVVSLKFWVSQLAYFALFGIGGYLWARQVGQAEIGRAYGFLLGSAAFVLGICLIEHVILGGTREKVDQAIKPFMREHTVYGAYAAWFFLAAIAWFAMRPTLWKLFFVGITGAALLLSYSRGAWLSVLGALGIWGLLEGFRRLSPLQRLVAVGLAGIALVGGLLTLLQYNPEYLEQQAYRLGGETGKHFASSFDVKQNLSNRERINRWFAALQMIEERPGFGFGPNTFSREYSAYQRSLTRTTISVELGEVGGAHSEYFTAASEMGLLGLLLLLAIYARSLWVGSKGLYQPTPYIQRGGFILLALPLLSYYLHGFINNFMDHGHMAGLVYLHWGLLGGLEARGIFVSDEKVITVSHAS